MAYFEQKLVVDNFAGGGGASTGIEWALGRPVDIAINHDRFALGMHRLNHPFTEHLQTDVFDVVPRAVTKGRKIGLAHFSPDCTHHSKAKGGKPVSRKIRGLVLVMLRWAKEGAEVMTMENVEEIRKWGPLVEMWKKGKAGLYPDPQHIGRTWLAFVACMTTGIDAEHPDLPEFLEVLDGTVTKEELVRGMGYVFEGREIRGYSQGAPTIRNRFFGIFRNDGRPIVWPAARFNDPKKLEPVQEKWPIIAKCLDFSLACPSIFLTKKQAKKVGCKRPLVKATLRRIATGMDQYVLRAEEPFIVATDMLPFITEHANASHQRNFSATEPMRTQCAGVKGGHFALVAGTLVQTGYGEREGQAPRALDPQAPLGTVVAGGVKHALAAAHLVKMRGTNIGSGLNEPVHTISAGGTHHGLVTAFLAQHNGGFNTVPGHDVREPISTISTRGSQQQLVAAHLVRHFGQSVGQGVEAPAPTVVAGGQGKTGLVAAHLVSFYGSEADGQSAEEPARTVTAKARMGLVESSLAHELTSAQLEGAKRVAAFLRKFGVVFEGEFATVAGHVIVDIGMRMLTPRELFRAQGFGDDYVIDRAWVVDPKTGVTSEVQLTKEQQIRMCGNSVCPQVLEAIVRANVPEMIMPHPPKKWRPSLELMKAAKLVA